MRATPEAVEHPESRRSIHLIPALAQAAPARIIAWGNIVPQVPHTTAVLRAMSCGLTRDLHAFGTTNSGAPKHPMAHARLAARDEDAEPR